MTTRVDRRRLPANRSAEMLALVVLESHRGERIGALELARRVGERWRPLAFALRRLASRGVVQEEIIEVPGTARSKEQMRRYWVSAERCNPLFPPVYAPPPGVARRVRGRVGWGRG